MTREDYDYLVEMYKEAGQKLGHILWGENREPTATELAEYLFTVLDPDGSQTKLNG